MRNVEKTILTVCNLLMKVMKVTGNERMSTIMKKAQFSATHNCNNISTDNCFNDNTDCNEGNDSRDDEGARQ